MAARLSDSTLAAGLKPALRESVNAVRGPDNALPGASVGKTAKGGNAITDAKKATTGKPGGDEAASDDRLGTHCHSGTPLAASPPDRGL